MEGTYITHGICLFGAAKKSVNVEKIKVPIWEVFDTILRYIISREGVDVTS